jgi:general secretion pathway protein D
VGGWTCNGRLRVHATNFINPEIECLFSSKTRTFRRSLEGTREYRNPLVMIGSCNSRLQSDYYLPSMRWKYLALAVCTLAVAAFAADGPQTLVTLPCVQAPSSAPGCNASKRDVKKAQVAFSKALKLEKEKHLDEAYEEFDAAARLVPRNLDYLTALAMVRQQLVYDHLQRGNDDLLKTKSIEAQAEFQSALSLDPQNDFARQRLNDSLGEWAPSAIPPARVVQDSGELHVVPNDLRADFHFRGDSKALLTQVAAAFGVTAELDDSVVSRRVHFDIDSVDFFTAINAASAATGAFWTPLSDKQIYVLKDTPENHRQFDRMGMRTFYVTVVNPADLNEVSTALRILFDARFVSQSAQSGVISVRAPIPILDAITKFMVERDRAHPQVMLDIEVFEIDHQLTRDMGVHIPNQFTLYNIPAAALAALGGQNIQSLVNQLISGGGINQANSQGIAGLLAQLGGQQNSIFSQPLATFGNGLTLFGVSLGTLSGDLSLNESWVKTVQHATLRAGQNADTNFRIGTRYPILNASFAPVFNTPAISQVLQNGSFQAPFPSFSYEDLGLIVKAKPIVHANLDVELSLDMEIRTLAGQSFNGVPVIANRQYKGSITLADGEPAVVAGEISQSEQRSLTGIPGLGAVPVLNKIMTSNSAMDESDELLVVITPHVLNLERPQDLEIWLPRQ